MPIAQTRLGVHAVLGEVLDVDFAEDAESAVDGDVSSLYALDFEACEEFAGEVESGPGSDYGTFDLGEDALIVLEVAGLGLAPDIRGKRGVTEGVEGGLELVVGAVVEEAEGAPAGGGVVDDFCHEGVVVAEVEFVSDSDFAGGLDEDVPELVFGGELAEEEDLDAGAGFFLVTVKQSREHACVVEDHHVVLVEEVDNLVEDVVRDFAGLTVHDHQARLVALGQRMVGDERLRQVEVEL